MIVNPVDHGADPTGSKDSTDAFKKIIDATQSGVGEVGAQQDYYRYRPGETITIDPPGRYKITKTLELDGRSFNGGNSEFIWGGKKFGTMFNMRGEFKFENVRISDETGTALVFEVYDIMGGNAQVSSSRTSAIFCNVRSLFNPPNRIFQTKSYNLKPDGAKEVSFVQGNIYLGIDQCLFFSNWEGLSLSPTWSQTEITNSSFACNPKNPGIGIRMYNGGMVQVVNSWFFFYHLVGLAGYDDRYPDSWMTWDFENVVFEKNKFGIRTVKKPTHPMVIMDKVFKLGSGGPLYSVEAPKIVDPNQVHGEHERIDIQNCRVWDRTVQPIWTAGYPNLEIDINNCEFTYPENLSFILDPKTPKENIRIRDNVFEERKVGVKTARASIPKGLPDRTGIPELAKKIFKS